MQYIQILGTAHDSVATGIQIKGEKCLEARPGHLGKHKSIHAPIVGTF